MPGSPPYPKAFSARDPPPSTNKNPTRERAWRLLLSASMANNAFQYAILVHGGAGNSKENENGCVAAAEKGLSHLRAEGDALTAAIDAVASLEEDGRFNAGAGSITRTDGSVEMDASMMDSTGRLGAVCCLRDVQNPVRVARRVADKTSHWMLAGEGAQRFARAQGFPPARRVAARTPTDAKATDTVGAVVLDRAGHFAVASSTGGSAPALPGRVGDTPIPGCGFWAGKEGAVAATGVGEAIVPHLLARTVYDWLVHGRALEQALADAIALFPESVDI